MLPLFVRDYTFTAIAGAPDVLECLLEGILLTDPVWDDRPNPARFTLREIVAHLADWNDVFHDRITRIRDENEPQLLVRNPEDVGREHHSFLAAPDASLVRFRTGRAALLLTLRALQSADWERTGDLIGHPVASGAVSIEAWAVAIAGHDGYHLQQVAQWLKFGYGKT